MPCVINGDWDERDALRKDDRPATGIAAENRERTIRFKRKRTAPGDRKPFSLQVEAEKAFSEV